MTGVENSDQGLLPKLRFMEFRDEGPWPVKPLSALAKRRSKRNSDSEVTRVLTNSAEHGVVDQRDYFEKDIATQGNLDAYFVVERGDYVYNPRISSLAPVGPIGKNKVGTGVMSPLYTVFRFSGDDDSFYEHYFRSTCWHGYLRRVSNSGARHDRMAIANSDFFEMPLPVPDLKEQKKITRCLSSLDALIGAEVDKLERLKGHKKGLMQQLFPAEGETIPRLRFPEFRGGEEWQLKPFNSLFKIGSGKDYKHLSEGNIPVYGSGGYMCSVNDYLYDGESVCIGRKGTIDKPMFISGKFWTVDTLFYTHSFRECLPKFVYAIFQFIDWTKHNEAGGVPSLSKTNIEAIEFAVPSIKEQAKIVRCLEAIDSLIACQGDKVAAVKVLKKALMQQLFPSSTEVSA